MVDSDHYTNYYNDQELENAIKIFQVYQDESLRKHARSNPRLALLFDLGKNIFLPSKEDLKNRRKVKKLGKKLQDNESLSITGIRQMRKIKAVSYSGGSIDIPLPPRIGTLEANDEFIMNDENLSNSKIQSLVTDFENKLLENLSLNENKENSLILSNNELKQDYNPKLLNFSRSCHQCGSSFKLLHHFYDQMCQICSNINYEKRFQNVNLNNKICLVTGARVKIGYCIALKLLRMGATVIVTTRFPNDAAKRYNSEPDSNEFLNRLSIYGLDFRDVAMLHHFCDRIKKKFSKIDLIISNAAQTVRRPPAYYKHLMDYERIGCSKEIRCKFNEVIEVYKNDNKYIFSNGIENDISKVLAIPAKSAIEPPVILETIKKGDNNKIIINNKDLNINESANMSQQIIIPEDLNKEKEFPNGLLDRDDQQIDLRNENSWTMYLGSISTIELVECHVINTFAPWILISTLRNNMGIKASSLSNELTIDENLIGNDKSSHELSSYIINVSAMEGQFYRPKNSTHPHTNMSKAALNMLTRTCAYELSQENIFMTSVDTGWITDENPVSEQYKRENQPPPLDEWDAAMRVLDPFILGVKGEKNLWGCFLKNYKPTRW